MTPLPDDYLPGLPLGFRYGMRFIWDPLRDGHSDDRAPGETFLTRWGITEMTWEGAVRDGLVSGTLAAATQAQLGNIYLVRYWQALSLSALPTAIGFSLFCDATLTGPGHCARLFQAVVGASVDGVIGPHTLSAAMNFISTRGQAALVDTIESEQLGYLRTLRNEAIYIGGWTAREKAQKALAHEIIASEAPAPTAAIA